MIKLFLSGFLLLLILFVKQDILNAQSKHALVITIGEYKYWKPISSNNDLPFVLSLLQRQQFPKNQIITLSESAATMQGINNAFKKLISNIQKDDIVYIHISSHGEQVEDNGNDELDGLDETIVTYDAMKPGDAAEYKEFQKKYFRDDQFGIYMQQLREKLGSKGDVLVFIDACHSGSGTRGTRKVRGGMPALVSPEFQKPKVNGKSDNTLFLESGPTADDERKLATYVVISAARADELNTEYDNDGTDMGSLTYAIGSVFEQLQQNTTYRSLFASILSFMNGIVPSQHPVLEGNGLDRILFGGKYVDQKPFIEIKELDGKIIQLNGGILKGLDTGAKVAVYPSGTANPDNAIVLANGIVTKATPYTSTVLLDKEPGILETPEGWVFIKEQSFAIKPTVVGLAANKTNGFSDSEIKLFRSQFQRTPIIKIDGEPDLLLFKGDKMDSLKIAANGLLFDTISKGDFTKLEEKVKRFAQFKFLEKIQLNDSTCQLAIKLLPIKNRRIDTSVNNNKIINGVYDFTVNDSVLIWVKNTGKQTVYFNILDLQPDGIINPILPSLANHISSNELRVDPGQEKIFENYIIQIAPPIGTETFKVFVSKTEIDMESIATNPDAKPKGSFSVLQKLVQQSYDIKTKGDAVAGTEKAEGSTFNIIFRIKDAN